jgi:methionine-rich copper-binding protein CopC
MRRSLATVIIAFMFAPTAAMAHSNAVEVNPADGAQVESLPTEATITFDEPPKSANVVLNSPDGKVHVLQARTEGQSVVAKLPSEGPRGTYGLSYRVVSADGHPVAGTTAFVVTAGPEPATPTPTPAAPPAPDTDHTFPMIAALGIAILALGAIVLATMRARR